MNRIFKAASIFHRRKIDEIKNQKNKTTNAFDIALRHEKRQ